jgi:dihydroorotate dehydrogenase electron transfer subunit
MIITERKSPSLKRQTRILVNRPIAHNQWQLVLRCDDGDLPDFDPGNFCMLSFPDRLEPLTPRPFAIVDRKEGAYVFIYKVTGKMTKALAQMQLGGRLDLLGPLGRGVERSHLSRGVHHFIAGGVGYATLIPLFEESQRHPSTPGKLLYGVRTDLELIRSGISSALIASDDGSVGLKGRVTDLIRSTTFGSQDYFYVCGPTPMMKAVYDLLPAERSFYFLEETMGCGFGICVGCVVPIRVSQEKVKNLRSCMEGPVFVGSQLTEWRVSQWV